MPYVIVTRTPGGNLDQYRAVAAEIGTEPVPGRLAFAVGESDGALHTVEVWDTRAHSERFASDRLFPAFTRSGVQPGPDSTYLSFETDDVAFDGAPQGAGR